MVGREIRCNGRILLSNGAGGLLGPVSLLFFALASLHHSIEAKKKK